VGTQDNLLPSKADKKWDRCHKNTTGTTKFLAEKRILNGNKFYSRWPFNLRDEIEFSFKTELRKTSNMIILKCQPFSDLEFNWFHFLQINYFLYSGPAFILDTDFEALRR
jgi:hypothetical protein